MKNFSIRSLLIKILGKLPDKVYLQIIFFYHHHQFINWKAPKTFNEKIQWLKIYCMKPFYTELVDKILVKEYVKKLIGEKYLIPTIMSWNSANEIDFALLPNKFILKTNHSGGNTGIFICRDKNNLNIDEVKEKFEKLLKQDSFSYGREYPYLNIKRKIFAEILLEDKGVQEKGLNDYKFFCFNGIPKIMYVATERGIEDTEVKFDFFDMNFKQLKIKNKHPNSSKTIDKPKNFEKMKSISSILSQNLPFARIDLYEVNNMIYFGEITLYHCSGFLKFDPKEWDYKLGEWLKIDNLITLN